ncbi:MAG: ATP synthase F0 subunit A [Candidatus Margulisiibacteriota bacterium]|nr:MAG: ATP synthase F0 subunit A [Candidatus Margulisbacteria bacterium GWD2_39_127]OGI02665.1 MAG: ATP synthase F0 subunit A [Candidatus Margulisbacteria bacterium GWF2_38_17]OGI05950.1 MAG: ATP synthase F0 subunit A [Candidatus Margulisbacteria bacterium GWE2_39_32]PZM79996.1 MAG: ATP synthase F0 subunit A [Candidatus Margulisiibacteriota bacterium]HAR62599.1 ATP synthase F0 subunit A [Candidatus Margulisiibacteriota bacterium]
MGIHEAQEALFTVHFLGMTLAIIKPVLLMWFISAFIIVFFFLALKIKRARTIVEMLIAFCQDQFLSSFPHYTRFWLVFFLSLFLFVATNNLVGSIPLLESPSGNLNFTASLALGVFFLSVLIGIKIHGRKYLKQFVPNGVPKLLIPLMAPIEIVTYLFRPLSLALRLFANMFAGHMIIVVFFTLLSMVPIFVGKFVPLVLIVGIKLFELFVCLIQAFIFTYLSASYISDAMKIEH